MHNYSRRSFLDTASRGLCVAGSVIGTVPLLAQAPGDRPARPREVTVLTPRASAPVSWIIDDSTCLVNLNRFAMPQFDQTFGGANAAYHKPWRDWPAEIPDSFVRKFGEWCGEHGVKGKYSVVPYPACVGRLDRFLPGWTQRELNSSLELVRTLLTPNWDIHPEMITHTRIIDLRTGQPFPDPSTKFMENWDWTTDRSAEELTEYLAYALRILKNAGLPCEGVTTPGGFGNRARIQLAQATLESVREVFGAEIPHYFRDLYDQGDTSVAPRVENASHLRSGDARCVVSIIGCTGDWTGGWDCTAPEGVERFIAEDLKTGRLIDVIERGEPAVMVSHWTGIYWNGQELGFKIIQEVVRRLHQRFANVRWMKLSEIARYWAAKELTSLDHTGGAWQMNAPFACPDFTLRVEAPVFSAPELRWAGTTVPLREVKSRAQLAPGTWFPDGKATLLCFDLPKGDSQLRVA